MKTISKTLPVILIIAILTLSFSCQRNTCRTMKHHNKDVKRGLAH